MKMDAPPRILESHSSLRNEIHADEEGLEHARSEAVEES